MLLRLLVLLVAGAVQIQADLPSCERARCLHCKVEFISRMCPTVCSACPRYLSDRATGRRLKVYPDESKRPAPQVKVSNGELVKDVVHGRKPAYGRHAIRPLPKQPIDTPLPRVITARRPSPKHNKSENKEEPLFAQEQQQQQNAFTKTATLTTEARAQASAIPTAQVNPVAVVDARQQQQLVQQQQQQQQFIQQQQQQQQPNYAVFAPQLAQQQAVYYAQQQQQHVEPQFVPAQPQQPGGFQRLFDQANRPFFFGAQQDAPVATQPPPTPQTSPAFNPFAGFQIPGSQGALIPLQAPLAFGVTTTTTSGGSPSAATVAPPQHLSGYDAFQTPVPKNKPRKQRDHAAVENVAQPPQPVDPASNPLGLEQQQDVYKLANPGALSFPDPTTAPPVTLAPPFNFFNNPFFPQQQQQQRAPCPPFQPNCNQNNNGGGLQQPTTSNPLFNPFQPFLQQNFQASAVGAPPPPSSTPSPLFAPFTFPGFPTAPPPFYPISMAPFAGFALPGLGPSTTTPAPNTQLPPFLAQQQQQQQQQQQAQSPVSSALYNLFNPLQTPAPPPAALGRPVVQPSPLVQQQQQQQQQQLVPKPQYVNSPQVAQPSASLEQSPQVEGTAHVFKAVKVRQSALTFASTVGPVAPQVGQIQSAAQPSPSIDARPVHIQKPGEAPPSPMQSGQSSPAGSLSGLAKSVANQAMQCPRQPNWAPCISKDLANERFRACCSRLGDGCQQLCNYDATLTTIQLAVLTGRCPLNKVADMMICASGYEDATPCCEAYNVFEPGYEHCRPYCNPAAGLPQGGVLSEKYKCLVKLTQIQQCFYVSQKP